jgi:CheY-like chemotaxis protein
MVVQPSLQRSSQLPVAELCNRKVCIVDDDPAGRKVLEQYTTSWSMQPTSAADAPGALVLLRWAAQQQCPFDVALVDISMPKPNGIDLARMIKQDPLIAATPVIILTSYGQRGEAALATEAGAAGYLAKPLRYTQLYECLRVVLAQSSGGGGSGGLSVDSGVGDGTVPRSIPRQTGLVTRHTLAEARAQQAERILLVDDNRPNQLLVVRMLERRGYRVDVVAGGSEALAAIAQQHYDLLFLDCFMPDMNGFETARRIRSSEPPGQRIPIIALTANVLPEDRQKCLDVGMDDCLAKPINREDLFAALARWLPIPQGSL